MSSCSGSVCLLLVLGVVFASGNPVQFISDKLKWTHDSIADVLGLKQPEIVSNPLFGSVIRSINNSCQRKDEVQLLNVTLDVYTRIFSSILQQSQHHDQTGTASLLDQLPDPERSQMESHLKVLQQKMEKLKSHLGHDREDVISKLNKIKVDDPLVQKKALAQYKEIYQAASVIGSRCGTAHSSAE